MATNRSAASTEQQQDQQYQPNQQNAPSQQEQQRQRDQRAAGSVDTQTSGRGAGADTSRDRPRSIQTSSERPGAAMSQRATTGMPTSYGGTSSPFSLMRRMAEDMDRILEDFGFAGPSFTIAPLLASTMQPGLGGRSASLRTVWAPQLETFRRGDKLVVRADLPGLRKEDVHVEVDDGILTIEGERSEEQVDERDDYYRSERSYGRFHRALPLPDGVTGEACEATFKDGVLEVTLPLPKEPERKARKIQIR